MQRRLFLTALFLGLGAAIALGQQPQPTKAMPQLPGVEADGAIRLHNTWTLRPVGKQLELGDYPVNIAVHPSGHYLAILHCGYGEHEIITVDIKAAKQRVVSRTTIEQGFYGLTFAP